MTLLTTEHHPFLFTLLETFQLLDAAFRTKPRSLSDSHR